MSDFSSACSIQFEDYFVLTGGYYTLRTVSLYMASGWIGDLPNLNFRRHSHACGHYYNDANDLVKESCFTFFNPINIS